MRFFDSVKMSFSGVLIHKSRSILTALGIIIGITSIMTIMAIGQSAENLIVGEVKKFGPTNVFIVPGREPKGPTEAAGSLLSDSLKLKDLKDLEDKSNIPNATRVIPYVFGSENVSFESEIYYQATVLGSNEYSKKNFDLSVAEGRFFDQFDVDQKNKVAVIGNEIKKQLFGQSDPLENKIKIGGKTLKVIGVLEDKGSGSFVNFNKSIVAPYTVVQQDILGIKHFQRIIVEADSIATVSNTIKDIKILLRNNHNIDNPTKDDFFIQTQEDIANRIKTVTGILTILLTSVAAISLVVGGVGIMNIMLVSVTERTREIGLRKALGAKNKDILLQFLFEALILTISGGIIGIIGGVLLSLLASYAVEKFAEISFPFTFSIDGMIWGIGISMIIGLIFGVFPAKKASQKSPIESLRQE